ncbi:MAG TPA: response regulator, partial [Terriglobales bacterium]
MPRRVLLADDSVTAQNMGRKILSDAGYEVVTVNNGSAALKKISEHKPDVIVLDVYMPGYSGLEVCQRVKETRDTAHIPVLLTVGKLEPFKQDEARRARADAFIVKPFEATELLAALGKLESTLVKVPDPPKDARFSRDSMESFERFVSESAPRFGDQESGWKARLKVPVAKAPDGTPEPEPPTNTISSFPELKAEQLPVSPASPVAAPAMERPIPAGIPHDITAEEIEAITAAAARVAVGVGGGKDFARLTATESATPAVEKHSRTEAIETAPATQAAAPVVPPNVESVAAGQVEKQETPVAAPGVEAISPVPVAETSPSLAGPAPLPSDVEAVLSSLGAPTAATIAGPPAQFDVEKPAPEPVPDAVTMAAAVFAEVARAITPRWIAEEVPVEASETALVLEKEMLKAQAPAVAEPAPQLYEPAPVDPEDEPAFAAILPEPVSASADRADEPSFATASASPQIVPVSEAAQPESIAVKAANVTVEGQTQGPDVTASAFHDVRPNLESAQPAPPQQPETREHQPTTEASGSTFPVSQGTGSPFGGASADSATTSTTDSAAPAAKVSETGPEAELAAATAAAWANWRDIRESTAGVTPGGVNSSNATSALSKEMEEFKAARDLSSDPPTPPANPEAAAAAAAAGGSSAPDANLS